MFTIKEALAYASMHHVPSGHSPWVSQPESRKATFREASSLKGSFLDKRYFQGEISDMLQFTNCHLDTRPGCHNLNQENQLIEKLHPQLKRLFIIKESLALASMYHVPSGHSSLVSQPKSR